MAQPTNHILLLDARARKMAQATNVLLAVSVALVVLSWHMAWLTGEALNLTVALIAVPCLVKGLNLLLWPRKTASNVAHGAWMTTLNGRDVTFVAAVCGLNLAIYYGVHGLWVAQAEAVGLGLFFLVLRIVWGLLGRDCRDVIDAWALRRPG